jgi:hypothetical protein
MRWPDSPLVWEVNDRPRPYFSQKFQEFAHAFRQFGTAPSKQDSSAGACTRALEMMEMVA